MKTGEVDAGARRPVRLESEAAKDSPARASGEKPSSSASVGSERVSLDSARYIKAVLDPDGLVAERQARVAEIKRRLDNNSYWSSLSSEELAAKVDEEVGQEIEVLRAILGEVDSE